MRDAAGINVGSPDRPSGVDGGTTGALAGTGTSARNIVLGDRAIRSPHEAVVHLLLPMLM